MTQTRPRIDDNLAADIRAYADQWHISFNAAVTILLQIALRTAQRPPDEDALRVESERRVPLDPRRRVPGALEVDRGADTARGL